MEQFLKRGLLEKNITFLLNDDLASNNTCPLTKAEGVLYKGANKASIKEAITDWAKNKMNDSPANLYLVFVDHGSTDSFVLDTDIDNNLKASDLALWIEILETSLSPQASQMEIITLLGFCHSGSFIDNLSRKDKKRIIITSAAANEESFKGPKDIIRDGSFFMSSFFKWVGDGESIKKSFEKAVQQTEIYTSSDFISYTSNYPFFDNALQHPFLDDNGDGIGSNDLSVIGSDGDLSEKVFIGVNASMNHTDISIIETTKTLFLNPDTNTAQELYAIIENFSNREFKAWIEIKKPKEEPVYDTKDAQQIWDTQKIEGRILGNNVYWDDIDCFDKEGIYQIFYYIKDLQSQKISDYEVSTLYKRKNQNASPYGFNLISPVDYSQTGISVRTFTMLDWENNGDPESDNITYSIVISLNKSIPENDKDTIIFEGIKTSYLFISSNDGIKDLTNYYWKVIAIDEYGEIRVSNNMGMFRTDNTNIQGGGLKGEVLNWLTSKPISYGKITAKNDYDSKIFPFYKKGYCADTLKIEKYQFIISIPGYCFFSSEKIEILSDRVQTKNFFLVPLSLDVTIILLQKLSGISETTINVSNMDINYDQSFGLSDVLFFMRQMTADTKK